MGVTGGVALRGSGFSYSLFLSSGIFRPQSRNQKQFQTSMMKYSWCAQSQTEQSKDSQEQLGCPVSLRP